MVQTRFIIDYRTAGLEGDMCILYGHNMLDGSMFKEIMNFRDKDFCKKHPTFDIYIGRKHYIYYVFSVFSGNTGGPPQCRRNSAGQSAVFTQNRETCPVLSGEKAAVPLPADARSAIIQAEWPEKGVWCVCPVCPRWSLCPMILVKPDIPAQ